MMLEKRGPLFRLDGSRLRQAPYALSLWQEGVRVGAVTEADTARLKEALLLLLSQRTEAFTAGKSSSVRVETGQRLFEGVLYTVGVALRAESTPERALLRLKEEGPAKLFDSGQARLRGSLFKMRLEHERLKKRCLPRKTCSIGPRRWRELPAFLSCTARRSFLRRHRSPPIIPCFCR